MVPQKSQNKEVVSPLTLSSHGRYERQICFVWLLFILDTRFWFLGFVTDGGGFVGSKDRGGGGDGDENGTGSQMDISPILAAAGKAAENIPEGIPLLEICKDEREDPFQIL